MSRKILWDYEDIFTAPKQYYLSLHSAKTRVALNKSSFTDYTQSNNDNLERVTPKWEYGN